MGEDVVTHDYVDLLSVAGLNTDTSVACGLLRPTVERKKKEEESLNSSKKIVISGNTKNDLLTALISTICS